MINEVIKQVLALASAKIDPTDIGTIESALSMVLSQYEIIPKKNEVAVQDTSGNERIFKSFIVTRKIEGCTDRTLRYYSNEVKSFMEYIKKPVATITTNDVRRYLAYKELEKNCSKVTINNERRVLNTFLRFCEEEGYVDRNVCKKIKKIKQPKIIKQPFTEEEIETMRSFIARKENSNLPRERERAIRDSAIIEFLLSTGCRVGELVGLKRSDFVSADCCVVYGKGQKERFVYLNTKARLALKKYLDTRTIESEYVFATLFKTPHKKPDSASESSIGADIRELGERCGIQNVHAHRFRRTSATHALNKGMRIEEVQKMLGHENIETTLIYAQTNQENVRESHKKYM